MFTPRQWFRFSLLLLLANQLLLLFLFGFRYTGSDDVLVWNVGFDYEHGIFREPFMYGQNYNPALEALLAVPLLLLRLPPHVVYPVITQLCAVLPFIAFAFYFRRKEKLFTACLFLLLPVLLPPGYGVLTTITRGFVTGIFFFAFYPLVDRVRQTDLRAVLFGLIAAVAVLVNPNALILAIPVALFEIFRGTWWRNLAGMLIGGVLPLWLYRMGEAYYTTHPDRLVHQLYPEQLKFNAGLISEIFAHADKLFSWLMPGAWPLGWLILPVLLLTGIFALRKKLWIAGAGAILLIMFILIACGFPKIHDGSPSVFFHSSRMFLALPLAVLFLLSFVWNDRALAARLPVLLGFAAVLLVLKIFMLPRFVDREMAVIKQSPVHERKTSEVCAECDSVAAVAKKEKAELVIALYNPGLELDHLKYLVLGCRSYHPDLPQTFLPEFERRTWVGKDEEKLRRSRILFVSGGPERWDSLALKYPGLRKVGNHPLMYLLENNTAPTIDRILQLKIP